MSEDVLYLIVWILVVLISLIGLVGGYFQLRLMEFIKHNNAANIFLGRWVFSPGGLEPEGRRYRKMIFVCWGLAGALVVLILALQGRI